MGSDPAPTLLTPGQRRLVGFAAAFTALLLIVAGLIGGIAFAGYMAAVPVLTDSRVVWAMTPLRGG